MKRNNGKRKINLKVVATGAVAITLIGIVGVSIVKFSGNAPLGSNILLNITSTAGNGVSSGIGAVTDKLSNLLDFRGNAKKLEQLEEENKELREELTSLRKNIEQTKSLQSLKKSLDYVDDKYIANKLSAKVISKNDGMWYTSLVISAGRDDGVKKNSLVMNGDGLIGIVTEVSNDYSKVVTLLDTTSSISFKLAKDSKYKGMIGISIGMGEEESNKSKGLLQGYMFDSDYDVIPGDNVVTSGLGLYPEDIPIGEVTKVVEDRSKSLKYVVIKPKVNFKNIDDVMIIQPRNI